jgi:glyoxylase I family protein
MTITAARLHHIALTVRDLDASVEWYGRVFGVRPAVDVPHAGGLGRLLTDEV